MNESISRKVQLWAIIILTAITMMPQYALQGWLALGGQPVATDEFWQALSRVDPWAWSIRALVEAWVLVYLFSSDARSDQDKKWLTRFEIALIALITVTLGPALVAIGQEKAMREALSFAPLYWLWALAIASYAPLMLGAVGFAFRLEKAQANIERIQAKSTSESKPKAQAKAIKPTKRKQAKSIEPQDEFACDSCNRTFATIQALSAHGRFCEAEPENIVETNGKHN